ncbi:MAG TPA: cytochrome c peroxidase [Ideonella sp.]|uniref:cytochrome-c peroxidase n=1 Tax=Ideonella sp. TaxID=1929293 RepID=UPI002E348B42|nr:cytochrome c peroxidase [Ideonella sp.]HEX5688183.1 cytochrome c peroxidase [Ideonella sp.]
MFAPLETPSAEQITDPQATLGRALFWDARTSANGRIACASCHDPGDWSADRRRQSTDAKGKLTARHSQPIFNAMMQTSLRWTGDRASGSAQAEGSMTGSMGYADKAAALAKLKALGYEPAFRAAFADQAEALSAANYGRALQAYQRTLVTPAPFDRYLRGQDDALSPLQKRGLRTFVAAGCAGCHSGALLGGQQFQKFGLAKDYWSETGSERVDEGRFLTTGAADDKYVFRVAMLRNVAKTAPYFHDGSVATLDGAVRVMASVQLGRTLPDDDVAAIVAFLESLTGDVPAHYAAPAQ